MNKFDRIYELTGILRSNRYPVSLQTLTERLECSPSTVKRLIAKCRYELHAPIRYDQKYGGYILDQEETTQHEVPGLWFSVPELQALLTTHEFLQRLQPGMLQTEFGLFRQRIETLLKANNVSTGELGKRIKILGVGVRRYPPEFFKLSVSATLQRRRLRLTYHSRNSDQQSERVISPQRLVHYRENWYLDCWCHKRDDFRTLALDRIRKARILDLPAIEISDEQLESHYASGYGIFGGKASHLATLRFSPERARWVAEELYHPDQQGEFSTDGSYLLTLPFSDERELILDILRFGDEVEVLSPDFLRRAVQTKLHLTLQKYTQRHQKKKNKKNGGGSVFDPGPW